MLPPWWAGGVTPPPRHRGSGLVMDPGGSIRFTVYIAVVVAAALVRLGR